MRGTILKASSSAGRTGCGALLALVPFLVTGCAQFETLKPGTSEVQGPAGSLHVDDGGTGGVPVVFVHAFSGNTDHWAAQLEHVRQTRRAVALDLRGHGRSDPPANGDYSMESLARDIAAVVDGLKLKRFVLVGHSMGGAASLLYAGAHPERVAGLLLVGAPGKTPEDQAQQVMASLESDYEKVMADYWEKLLAPAQPEVRERIKSERERLPRDTSMSLIQAVFAYEPVPALRSYRGPKLAIITNEEGQPYALHRLVGDLPHKVIPGTSHWPQLDKPEEFNQVLDEFLETAANPTQ